MHRQYLLPALLSSALLVSGCAGTKQLDLQGDFPVPLMAKAPLNMGIHLDSELTSYTYTEEIEKKGEWVVALGPIQQPMFTSLAAGLFASHRFVDQLGNDPALDGAIRPAIKEVQFSLPEQTRSDYYEVWIRYQFQLYDREGNLIGEWDLPAYGKASNKNFGNASSGLQAAAMAASRDAMAFFSINFASEPVVRKWIADGMPVVPAQPAAQPPAAQPPAASDGSKPA